MGALAADSAWTSEDDFKLKSAAQMGTSFESLATGGVQFSKQYTVQELHDRWHAILYDPVVAAEASVHMLEYEFFTSFQRANSKIFDDIEEDISVFGKRKPESVRKRYHTMRKRMRIHPLNPLDLSFPDATFNNISIENEEQPPTTDFVIGKPDDHHADINLGVDHETLYNENQNCIGEDNYLDESDEFKEIYDLLDEEGPELPVINDQTLHLPPHDSSTFLVNENEQQTMATTSNLCADTNANNYLMEISNTLFDLMEDDLPHLDAEMNVIDKSYLDGLSSLLLDSPDKDTIVSTMPDECGHEESKSLEGIMGIMLPSTSGMNSKSHTSMIICTLNTEDPDIPSNDDVFLLPFTSPMPMPRPSPHKTPIRDSGVGWKRDFGTGIGIPKPIPSKDNKHQKSQFDTPVTGSKLQTQIPEDHKIKQDLSNNYGQHEGQNRLFTASEKVVAMKSEQDMHQDSDIFTNCAKLNAISGTHEEHAIQKEETLHEIVSKEEANPIMGVLQLPIDDDVSSLSDDDDIPSFSDVEAMVLDEKLNEDEKKLYLNGNWSYENLQTLKYKNANFQRKFIRLEQAANGFLKRDMTSWEAFALLQGWQLIYYVKKTEILMGRATEDVIVDVDLGREGDCRISRRQAIIHLDREGFFHIKNLGKYSIFVNSDELSKNQSTLLTSSCLIEIRGMPFLFEINEESIKRYLDSMKIKSDLED